MQGKAKYRGPCMMDVITQYLALCLVFVVAVQWVLDRGGQAQARTVGHGGLLTV